MDIQVKLEKRDNAQVQLEINVLAKDVDRSFDVAYKSVGSKVKLPGFRPGKVPRNILKQRYEFDVKSQAFEHLISRAIDEAVKKEELIVVSSPELDEVAKVFENLKESQDFSFKANLETYPTIELGDYKGLKATVKKYYYDKSHINSKLEEMQKRMAEVKTKENDIVEKSDLLNIQYNYYLVAKDEANNRNQPIRMDTEDPILESFQNELLGMKVGEEKNFPVTIPLEYDIENMRGKKGNINIKILEIEEESFPPLDDELAKDYNFETLDELKKDIEKNLSDAVENKKKEAITETLVKQIIESSTYNMGQGVIENQVEHQLTQFQNQLAQFKVPIDAYLERMNKSIDDLKNGFKEGAEQDVKFELVRAAIIEKEKIEVTDEDLEEQYKNFADYAKISFDEAKKKLNASQEVESLKQGKLYQKVMDFLIEQGDIEEKGKEAIFDIS